MTSKPKIAVDGTALLGRQSGVGRLVQAYLDRFGDFEELDISAFAMSARRSGELAKYIPRSISTTRFPVPARLAHSLWSKVDLPAIRGFDVVHGFNYVVPPARRARRLVSVHDLTQWRYSDLAGQNAVSVAGLVERSVKRGAHVHAISHFVGGEITDEFKIDSDRVHVIPCGVDTQRFRVNRNLPRAIDPPYVLAIGTIEPRKDYGTLLRAMGQLWGEYKDLRLVIVGARGWGVSGFDEALEHLGGDERVIEIGYASDRELLGLLNHAAIVAYPSIYEGFGLPLLEAMAVGIPVVATDIGATREVADDAAKLVPVGDSDGFANAIAAVLSDAQVAQSLVDLGFVRVRKYSWDESAARMVELYKWLAQLS